MLLLCVLFTYAFNSYKARCSKKVQPCRPFFYILLLMSEKTKNLYITAKRRTR